MKKYLGFFTVFSIALGAMIGWGCFILPGTDFLPNAGPAGTAIALILGAVCMVVISSSYGYLVMHYPGAGGEFTYIQKVFGKGHAFAGAWVLTLSYGLLVPINGTAIGMLFRFFFPGLIQVGYLYNIAGFDVYLGEVLVAMMSIILLAIFNIRGVKCAGWIQTGVSVGLILAIVAATAGVFTADVDFENLRPLFPLKSDGSYSFSGTFAVFAVAPWAFMGFDCVPHMSEEYNFPHSKTKYVLFASLMTAALLYICMVFVTAVASPWQELLSKGYYWSTGAAIYYATGAVGLIVISIAMICGIVSTMNAFYMSCSRLMYSMAREKAMPDVFGKLHPKYQTPDKAILAIAGVSLIAPWFGREVLSWIVDMTAFGTSIVFLYTTLAAAKVAGRNRNKKQVFLSLLGSLFCISFILALVLPNIPGHLTTPSVIALVVWAAIGAAYWFKIKEPYLKHNEETLKEQTEVLL